MQRASLKRAAIAGFFAALLLPAGRGVAEDWPNWRGPRFDGSSSETNFRKRWTGELPKLWETPIGEAFAGISVVGDRVYTCGSIEKIETVFCLQKADGKILWHRRIEKNFRSEWGNGARSTPTVDGDHIYFMGSRGRLVCLNAADGKIVWSNQYSDAPAWGYASSPLVRGDLLLVVTGSDAGTLAALNKQTGAEVWHCGDDGSAGYSSPYPFTFAGVEYVCAFLGKGAIIAEVKTGRQVLRLPWNTDWRVNATTPIFHDGYLWLGSGYQTGCAVFKLDAVGDKLKAQEVWSSKVMLPKFQSPVLHQGKLYVSDERAFKCVDFLTGKRHWQVRGSNGTMILADGHLITLSEKGLLQVAPASPDGFNPTGETQVLDDRCWTVPTLADGRLYARNMRKMVCYDMRP